MEFLKVEDLCKVYGRGENRVAALDHVSLSVEQGDFIAIVGSSGSGKSTLLHAIAGVDIPTSGRVLLNEMCIRDSNAADSATPTTVTKVRVRFRRNPCRATL